MIKKNLQLFMLIIGIAGVTFGSLLGDYSLITIGHVWLVGSILYGKES